MFKRMVLVLCLALMPSAAWAQVQESYLPSKSQLYFRWDGMKTHQADFDKTAVGKMMKGDTGKFVEELGNWAYEQVNNVAGAKDPKIGGLLKDFTKLLGGMYREGIVLGLEVDQIVPQPKAEAVLVFPKGAGEAGTLIPLIQRIVEETKANPKSTKVGNRFVNHVEIEMLKVGWWAQGADAVLFLGTTDPVAYAKRIDGKQVGIAKHPLYQRVKNFKEFKTCTRGYFDMANTLNVVSEIAPPAAAVIDELGLKGLKNITFVSGFDGPGERSVVEVEMPGPRKGLLSLVSQKKISLKDLPVLPSDVTGFTASTIKLSKTYDVFVGTLDGVVRIFDANTADDIKDKIKDFQGAIGKDFDLGKDLFGSLDDMIVSYSSPSDGILGTGAVLAVKLKDGKKLKSSLEKIVKAIPGNPAGELKTKSTMYRGGEIIQIQVGGPQFNFHLGTLGIYKNWLIWASYPQPIKGFILRQEGELPAWKADESLTKALSQFPDEFTSIRISDPRSTVQTVLAATPFVLNLANTFGGMNLPFGPGPLIPNFRPFDLELIPHAQEATRHLFPNITVTTDDGKRIRSETRGSLLLPF